MSDQKPPEDPPTDPPPVGPPATPDAPEAGKVVRLPELRQRERARERVRQPPTEQLAERRAKVVQLLGPKCPYEPIGYDGRNYWLMDCEGHLQQKAARELTRNEMVGFCGDAVWLAERYPRFRQGKPVNGFACEQATEQLINACQMMGYWNRAQHERGLGAWLGEDGDLILHRGNVLLVKGATRKLGRHGEYVYTPRPALPRLPAADEKIVARGAEDLLERLDTFFWTRGTFDSMLALGWICAAMIGGALPFRPHIWFTGELGAGKSTLQRLLNAVFSWGGILSITDSTAAGIRQSMNFASTPVGYDEFEAAEDPERQNAVLKVIRDASSGGTTLRGGAGHDAASFPVVSCFACSSIIVPPMPAQDLSRFVILNMTIDDSGQAPRPFSIDRLELIGAALMRRMAERFGVLTREVIPAFGKALIERGASRRIADIYATVFGAAAVALYDDVAQFRFEDRWLATHHMETLLQQSLAEQTPEWRRCMDYLLATPTDRYRPESASYGDLIERAVRPLRGGRYDRSGVMYDLAGEAIAGDGDGDDEAERAQRRLIGAGIRVLTRLDGYATLDEPVLVIANTHRGLAEIFAGTVWRTLPHAAGGGGWAQVFRRAPGARPTKRIRFRGGLQAFAVAIPISAVLAPDGPGVAAPAEAAQQPQARPAVH